MVRRSVVLWTAGAAVGTTAAHVARSLAPIRPELWHPSLLDVSSVRDARSLARVRDFLTLPTGGRPGVEVTARTATWEGRTAPVLWFEPRRRAPGAGAYLWIHGGGLVAGSAAADTAHCSDVAAELGIPVVSVDYRLAPEHPFPAALDDCHTALRWLIDRGADDEVDPERVAVGGASAGGGLAAAVCQRVRDRGERPPCCQVLRYPMLDHRTGRGSWLRRYPWTPTSNRFGWRSYLGAHVESPPPHAVPALADDLTGLPPAWIGVGEADLFHDEARRYAARLVADGVPATFDAVPGMYHGADAMRPDAASMRAFRRRETDALATGLAGIGQTLAP